MGENDLLLARSLSSEVFQHMCIIRQHMSSALHDSCPVTLLFLCDKIIRYLYKGKCILIHGPETVNLKKKSTEKYIDSDGCAYI